MVQIVDEFNVPLERLRHSPVKRFERKASGLFSENLVERLDCLGKLNNVRLLLLRSFQQRLNLIRPVCPVIDVWTTEVCLIL